MKKDKNWKKQYEEMVEARRMWCRDCEKEMKLIGIGSEFGVFGVRKAYYCDNKKCDKFGYLTIAGLTLESPPKRDKLDREREAKNEN